VGRAASAEDDWDWGALHRRCVREALRLGAAHALADDIAQNTLLRAWQHRARCPEPARRLAWVLTICRNETWRLFAARRDETLTEETEIPAGDETLEYAPTRVDVRRELARLGRDDRTLLWLRYGLGMTQPEVAAALGIAEGTAKVRLHRLRKALRSSPGLNG
jgi:RNA polymerase sigma-70 factor (ECF subfamily)